MTTIEQRLARIERQLRLWRTLGVLGIGGLLASTLCGQAPQVVTFDTIRCRTLAVVDDNGNPRVALGPDGGSYGMVLVDPGTASVRARLQHNTRTDRAELVMLGGTEADAATLRATVDKTSAQVGVYCDGTKRMTVLEADATRGAAVTAADAIRGRNVFINPSEAYSMMIGDGKKALWSAP